MLTLQALQVFAILSPGFLARTIVGSLTPRRKSTSLEVLYESVMFSLVVYLIIWFFWPTGMHSAISRAACANTGAVLEGLRPLTLVALGAGAVLGTLYAIQVNYDLFHRALRWIGVTRNTARIDTWFDVFFDMRDRSVIVTLGDGRRIFGSPEYYSHGQDEGCVFLADPEWIDNDGNYTPLQLRGILLTKNEGIRRVEFLQHKHESEGDDSE